MGQRASALTDLVAGLAPGGRGRAAKCMTLVACALALFTGFSLATWQDAAAATSRATVRFHRGDDWRHLGRVLYYYSTHQPQRPMVLLLGGSAARESTLTKAEWRRQVKAMGGPSVLAFNLGTSNQTYDHSIRVVEHLPEGAKIVVFIGVNLGRYTRPKPPNDGSLDRVQGAIRTARESGATTIGAYAGSRFVPSDMLSVAEKRAAVTKWLRTRYPVFKKYRRYNEGRLRDLVQLCLDRGYRPVIVNLPINRSIVGRRLNTPRAQVARNCRAVAQEFAAYGVRYVDWVPKVPLRNTDFVDSSHMLRSGRVKWQPKLSRLTVNVLKDYLE